MFIKGILLEWRTFTNWYRLPRRYKLNTILRYCHGGIRGYLWDWRHHTTTDPCIFDLPFPIKFHFIWHFDHGVDNLQLLFSVETELEILELGVLVCLELVEEDLVQLLNLIQYFDQTIFQARHLCQINLDHIHQLHCLQIKPLKQITPTLHNLCLTGRPFLLYWSCLYLLLDGIYQPLFISQPSYLLLLLLQLIV